MRFLLGLVSLGKILCAHINNRREGSDCKTKLQNVRFCELEILVLRAVAYLAVARHYNLMWTRLGARVPPVTFLIARFREDGLGDDSK